MKTFTFTKRQRALVGLLFVTALTLSACGKKEDANGIAGGGGYVGTPNCSGCGNGSFLLLDSVSTQNSVLQSARDLTLVALDSSGGYQQYDRVFTQYSGAAELYGRVVLTRQDYFYCNAPAGTYTISTIQGTSNRGALSMQLRMDGPANLILNISGSIYAPSGTQAGIGGADNRVGMNISVRTANGQYCGADYTN